MCFTLYLVSMGILQHAAGDYYINDKSTGSVVEQQPFGVPGLQYGGSQWVGLSGVGAQWMGF